MATMRVSVAPTSRTVNQWVSPGARGNMPALSAAALPYWTFTPSTSRIVAPRAKSASVAGEYGSV